jgi:polyhydroxyalkanoate synthase
MGWETSDRRTTWLVMDEWLAQWSPDTAAPPAIGTNRKRRHSSAASRSLAT